MTFCSTFYLFPPATRLACVSTLVCAGTLAFALPFIPASALAEEATSPSINLAPTEEELNWAENLTGFGGKSGLNGDIAAPLDAPQTTTLLERNGITPDIRAGAASVGATQRIELGSQGFADQRGKLTPYVELGADVAKSGDEPLVTGSTVNADVTTGIGGGTTVSVNDQVDFKLGVTRQDTLGQDRDAENKVESGVSIKF